MPRLSSKHYLDARRSLGEVRHWLYELNPDDVLAVSRFFAPTKPFTDAEALSHRRKVTAADPSLPHRVGKILKKQRVPVSSLERKVARSVGVPELGPILIGPKGREKVLRVTTVRRETVDLRKLAHLSEMDMRKPVGKRIIDHLAERDHDEAA